ncbi:hypothetical protein ONZ45_g14634 [Pleurotus djamor]|nr:hypothetical protein ONZ45_g14634 [Pleurotus djamor]
MPASVTKVIYKPDTQSTDEYTVLVNPVEFKKWKDGDTTIPLVEVVDSYKVFFSNQGSQGILGEASKQQRESVCGSSNADEAVLFVLKRRS